MFKDEVRREYYLKHGVKNVFPSGLLESSSLDITTPYMLRNDGELLKCGDYHPYIKSYRKESLEETIIVSRSKDFDSKKNSLLVNEFEKNSL